MTSRVTLLERVTVPCPPWKNPNVLDTTTILSDLPRAERLPRSAPSIDDRIRGDALRILSRSDLLLETPLYFELCLGETATAFFSITTRHLYLGFLMLVNDGPVSTRLTVFKFSIENFGFLLTCHLICVLFQQFL